VNVKGRLHDIAAAFLAFVRTPMLTLREIARS